VESILGDLTKHFYSVNFDSAAATLKFSILSRILGQKPHLSALSRPLVLFTHKFFY